MPVKTNPSKLMLPMQVETRIALKHIHSYIRHGKTKTGIIQWKCSDPDCMYLISQDFIIGKRTLCSHCMEHAFVLTREDMRRARPRCPQQCSTVLEHQISRTVKSKSSSIIDSLFPGAEMTNPIGDD